MDGLNYLHNIRHITNNLELLLEKQTANLRRSQHVPSGSRETMYRRAMSLMSKRCASAADINNNKVPLLRVSDPPINIDGPKVFFVHQQRPVPMPPLKVWRGYHGNVYFEPIKVISSPSPSTVPRNSQFEKGSEPLRHILNRRAHTKSRSTTAESIRHPKTSIPRAHSVNLDSMHSRQKTISSADSFKTFKSSTPSYMKNSAVLDKSAVFQEDMDWIFSQESTGSLCIMPQRKTSDPRLKWDRERICKGSVARKVFTNKGSTVLLPVNGNKTTKSNSTTGGTGAGTGTRTVHKSECISPTEPESEQVQDIGNRESSGCFQHIIPTLDRITLDEHIL